MSRVALGIGSNIDRRANIRCAVELLRERFGEVKVSPVYRSRAVGFEGPDFYNLVCIVDTELEIGELQSELRRIETSRGRQRTDERFLSRTLDIDILLFDDADLHDLGYDVPRSEITRYAFVLKPLADLAPTLRHPESGIEFQELWRQLEAREGSSLGRVDWTPDHRENAL